MANATVVMLGLCAPYAPQKAHNVAKWAPIHAAIIGSNGKGITLAALKAIAANTLDPAMANYVVKRGWVQPLGAKVTVRGVTYVSKATA